MARVLNGKQEKLSDMAMKYYDRLLEAAPSPVNVASPKTSSYRRRQLRFVSEVLGRPEDGTRDSGRFPISQDFWGGWKGGSRRRVARGGLGSSSCPPPVGR